MNPAFVSVITLMCIMFKNKLKIVQIPNFWTEVYLACRKILGLEWH